MSGSPQGSLSVGGRLAAAVVWVLLLVEAVWIAPPARPDQTEWLLRLMRGDWAGEEPLVVALFNLMGVWPFVLGAQLAPWLRGRPVPLWPFALGSMVVGAFVLLPGLVVGGSALPAPWQRWLDRPVWLGFLAVVASGLAIFGGVAGDPAAYQRAFWTESFVHVMSFDFLALWFVSVLVARERGGPWVWALVPILGGLAWSFAISRVAPARGR